MARTNGAPGRRAKRRNYWCFLIRCRLEESAGPQAAPDGSKRAAWRFTIQPMGRDPARRSFACLRDMAAYIEAQLEDFGPPASEKTGDRAQPAPEGQATACAEPEESLR